MSTPLLVDSHCHLNFPDFTDDYSAVIARAKQSGVQLMLSICTKLVEFETIHAIAMSDPSIYCTVGIHPNEAAKAAQTDVQTLCALAKREKVVGFGETGLDYHYSGDEKNQQMHSFKTHIEAGIATDLPLVIHTRDAEEDTADLLKTYAPQGLRGVLHCFTGTHELAKLAVSLGFYISFSGILTFKNSEDLRQTARSLPLERILVETDAPYLAPIPYRGKRNEPGFVVHTNEMLAKLHGISPQESARITTANFHRLFNKVPLYSNDNAVSN